MKSDDPYELGQEAARCGKEATDCPFEMGKNAGRGLTVTSPLSHRWQVRSRMLKMTSKALTYES